MESVNTSTSTTGTPAPTTTTTTTNTPFWENSIKVRCSSATSSARIIPSTTSSTRGVTGHRDSTSFITSVSREEQPEPKKAAMDSMGCAGLTGQHHLMSRDRPQAIKSQAQVSGSAESWEQPDDFCRGSSVSLTRPRSDRRQEPCA